MLKCDKSMFRSIWNIEISHSPKIMIVNIMVNR